MEIFNVEKISYKYRNGKKAVDEVSFRVKEGESLTIIGTNGSGKSTLLFLLDGLLEPESGSLRVFGTNIKNGFPPDFRRRISLLFQNPQTQLFSLSVFDELSFGPIQLGLKKSEVAERVNDLLKLLQIEDLQERGPWDLSGGEMKKVALGTCLSINPDVLLLDEPTSGLDPRSQVDFIDIIQKMREAGKTIITTTHDLAVVEDISDRTLILREDQRLLKEGLPHEILKDRDLLLTANLIHKHPHRHAGFVHEHSHYAEHDHEHLPEVSSAHEPVVRSMVTAEFTDIDKLKKLLEHWLEHNRSHRETYAEWSGKMDSLLKKDAASMLKEIAEGTESIERLFLRLMKLL